jgi:ribulose-5-phosphate 4-epimerase/fuculose-1-phosphate aldolase
MSSAALSVPGMELEWKLRRELAAVYRLVAHFRMTDLIFTHISVRLPGPEHHFLINPYGLMFEEISASSLIKIDLEGEAVTPTHYKVNPAGFVIHSAIHQGRDDAKAIVHTHTRAGCAVAAQRDGLLPVNQMALSYYNKIGYHDYEGIAVNPEERARIVEDLGDNDALILRNHGLLTVGETPREAFMRMYYLERSCEIQLSAQAAELQLPSAEVCEYVSRYGAGKPGAATDNGNEDLDLLWAALMRLIERVAPDYQN